MGGFLGGGFGAQARPGANYTASITIRIIDGTARRQLQRTQREVKKTGTAFGKFGGQNRALSRIVGTFTKALISMAAVLVAFNAFVTGPQFALQIIVQGFRAAIEYAAAFESRIIALQAVLASKLQFKTDPLENFIETGLIAENMMNQFARRAGEMVGSIEDATLVMNVLIARGAESMVGTMDEMRDLSILLVNAIAAVTPQQQLQRQLAEETASLITGRLRATSVLPNVIFGGDRKAFDEFLAKAKANNSLLQDLTKRLKGVDLASVKLGGTLEGITKSFESLFQLLSARGLGGEGPVGQFLTVMNNFVKSLLSDEDGINRVAAAIATSFQLVGNAIGEALGIQGLMADRDALIEKVIDLIQKLTYAVLVLVNVFETLARATYYLYSAMINLMRLMGDFHVFLLGFVGLLAGGWLGALIGGFVGLLLGADNTVKVIKVLGREIEYLFALIRGLIHYLDWLAARFWTAGSVVVDTASWIADKIGNWLKRALDTARPFEGLSNQTKADMFKMRVYVDHFIHRFRKHVKSIEPLFQNAITKTAVTNIERSLKDSADSFGKYVSDLFNTFVHYTANIASHQYQVVKDIDASTTGFIPQIQASYAKIVQGMDELWTWFKRIVDDAVAYIRDYVHPVVVSVLQFLYNEIATFLGWVERLGSYINYYATLGYFGRNPFDDLFAYLDSDPKLEFRFFDELDYTVSSLQAAVGDATNALIALTAGESAFAAAARQIGPWSDLFVQNLIRIEEHLNKVGDAMNEIPQKPPHFDFGRLFEDTEALLKSTGITRRQVRHIRKVLTDAFEGILPRDLIQGLGPDAHAFLEILEQDAAKLLKLYNETLGAIQAAELSPHGLQDPEHMKQLQENAKLLRGEIAALAGEYGALKKVLLDAGSFMDILAQSFDKLFLHLKKVGDEFAASFKEKFINPEITEAAKKYLAQIGEKVMEVNAKIVEGLGDKTFVERIKQFFTDTWAAIKVGVANFTEDFKVMMGGVLKHIRDVIFTMENFVKMARIFGDVLADALAKAIQGTEGFVEAIKKAIGAALIQLGTMLMSAGFFAMILGAATMDLALAASGAIAVAAGAAFVALGHKLSGGGSSGAGAGAGGGAGASTGQQEFVHSQQSIAAQQYFNAATENRRRASDKLYGATKNISGVKAGEVFMRGADESGGVTRVLANDARRSDRFGQTRKAALAFGGGITN